MFDDDTEREMALELNISRHTLHTQLKRLYRKLGVSSRTALVVCVLGEYVAQDSPPS